MELGSLRPIKSYLLNLLEGDEQFRELLGEGVLAGSHPNDFSQLPIVVYKEDNQTTDNYADNVPVSRSSVVSLHVFTAGTVSTYPIAKRIDELLIQDLWNCEMSADTDEPLTKFRHRVMRYSRGGITPLGIQ